jgi:hypothetical protein
LILKKNSSHKLPKQQSTSFWSQGILGVKWHQEVGALSQKGQDILTLYLEKQGLSPVQSGQVSKPNERPTYLHIPVLYSITRIDTRSNIHGPFSVSHVSFCSSTGSGYAFNPLLPPAPICGL